MDFSRSRSLLSRGTGTVAQTWKLTGIMPKGHSGTSSISSLLASRTSREESHSRTSSISSLVASRTSREESLDHDIYVLADRKGTFSNQDKLSRLRNCIQYIYGSNVVVKLLARPRSSNKSKKFNIKNEEQRKSVPNTVDEIIAIERAGTVSTSKILYYA